MCTMRQNPSFRRVAALLLALALIAGVSGCTSTYDSTGSVLESPTNDSGTDSDALESFVEAERPAAMREMERYRDIYSDFSLEAEGSRTLVHKYTYRNQVDEALARSHLERSYDTLRATAVNIFAEMKNAGVEDPAIKWIYYNADGGTIKTFRFPD